MGGADNETHQNDVNGTPDNPQNYFTTQAPSQNTVTADNISGASQNTDNSTNTEETSQSNESHSNIPDTSILNNRITPEEVLYAIKHLKKNKAYGIDLIVNEFLKSSYDKLHDLFVELFNLVLDTGIIPSAWCTGVIKPIFKNKGSVEDPNNYRGITILSCFGKLFTSILNNRIKFFIEKYEILGSEQAGFRENHSTTDHLFTLYAIIDILLAKSKRLYCAFLDYEKAFDKVDRIFLWQKLLDQKIEGKILIVIQNMYAAAKSCVMSNSVPSEFFSISIGVRQGENLSPVLFSLFLNDMQDFLAKDLTGLETIIGESVQANMDDNYVNNLLKLFLLLYADDTIIFSETASGIQKGLSSIKNYCDNWKLKLNASKCKIVIFSRGKVRKFPIFTIGEDTVEVVSSFLYLGLKLNYNNHMTIAHKDLYDRASRAMFALLRKCTLLNLPIDVTLDLFDKTIVPILTYGSEVWGFEKFDILQKLQVKFYKIVLKLRVSTPNMMVFGETGRFPLRVDVKVRILSFWYKLISEQNKNKLSSIIYKLQHRLYCNGTHESLYLKFIRACLIEVGLPHIWYSQNVTNINFLWFKNHIKQPSKDLFIQEWHANINDIVTNPIFINYRLFKSTFQQEPLIKLLPNDCVTQLVKFRTTNNRLPVNQLRYEGVLRHQRICVKCNLQEVGDEFHYIFVCPFFSTKRCELIPKYYTNRPNVLKFRELLNTESKPLLLKLKHFICILDKEMK